MIASTVATLQDNSTHGEDTFLTRDLGPNAFLDAVMDGVTGHGGKEASRSLSETLATAKIASAEDLVAVLEEVNQDFFLAGGGRMQLSTIAAALFLDDHVYTVSAGDSPVFLVRGNSFESLSGKVGGFLPVGAARAVGSREHLQYTRAEATIEPGDRLVLATDGVSDCMQPDELAKIVRAAATPQEAVQRVTELIEARLKEGRMPGPHGERLRQDDRTAIFRFFGPAR
jgi:protein phosphatase